MPLTLADSQKRTVVLRMAKRPKEPEMKPWLAFDLMIWGQKVITDRQIENITKSSAYRIFCCIRQTLVAWTAEAT